MTNNGELSPSRQAAVTQAAQYYQEVAAERDGALAEIARLKSDIAAYKVTAEAQMAQLSVMDSRVATMMLVRDQAVADRAVYEALFISLQAQMRAFEIPVAPLIKETQSVNDR